MVSKPMKTFFSEKPEIKPTPVNALPSLSRTSNPVQYTIDCLKFHAKTQLLLKLQLTSKVHIS